MSAEEYRLVALVAAIIFVVVYSYTTHKDHYDG